MFLPQCSRSLRRICQITSILAQPSPAEPLSNRAVIYPNRAGMLY
ncbi:hypothetical protein KNP414_02078 [Paenibacillus mucilaginosus KNP414]|uniref:Uncharacterized protein n=1 Tax=Paenibacillus mucilaginosus (strain KNP414) TaxID=1036673 RepID=F8FRT2_PAEMK|nr:hypothetical protein KNP414_02078 [Paenibacillus mucilaginosus KNP414]